MEKTACIQEGNGEHADTVCTCVHVQSCMYMYNDKIRNYMYMENHVHSTLAINRYKKESRHGEQTLTHYSNYMYSDAMA